jgi:hypothetical protein
MFIQEKWLNLSNKNLVVLLTLPPLPSCVVDLKATSLTITVLKN